MIELLPKWAFYMALVFGYAWMVLLIVACLALMIAALRDAWYVHRQITKRMIRVRLLEKRSQRARALVNDQANDAGLWFEAETAPEAYLQQELRKLHAVIENQGVNDGSEGGSAAIRSGGNGRASA